MTEVCTVLVYYVEFQLQLPPYATSLSSDILCKLAAALTLQYYCIYRNIIEPKHV